MSGKQAMQSSTRKSFAQVAAAASKPVVRGASPNPQAMQENGVKHPPEASQPRPQSHAQDEVAPVDTSALPEESVNGHTNALVGALQLTSLEDHPLLSFAARNAVKHANSDTKSTASRTTLTLDEKDSLRPDDSASMQAAPEEDASSLPSSVVANSRLDSDSDPHGFQSQGPPMSFQDGQRVIMPRAQRPAGADASEDRSNGMVFVASQSNAAAPLQPMPSIAAQSLPNWSQPPDEKLLEALASPKDRLFVLKVEQDLIDFVKDPKEEYLQLPGTNSFYRMLSHKLADYYMLGHAVDESMSSVRIYRTPLSRLPPPLIGSNPGTHHSTPPPSSQARMIMRRNENLRQNGKANSVDCTADSMASSKSASDNGSGEDAKDAKLAEKSSMTREERENRYKEARARIFKDFEKDAPDSNPTTDKEPSRSSSASGFKRNKKSKKPKDDGFEARSAFDPYGRRLSGSFHHTREGEGQGDYYGFDADGRYLGSNAMQGQYLPTGAFGQTPGAYAPNGAWAQSSTASHYSSMTHEYSDYLSPSNGHDSSPYGPNNSETTPKGTFPELSNFHPPYISSPQARGWAQDGFAPSFVSQAYYDYGPDYAAHHGSQQMPTSPRFNNFNPPRGFGQSSYMDAFPGSPIFNPQSQTFVPAPHPQQFMYANAGSSANYPPQMVPANNVPRPFLPSNSSQSSRHRSTAGSPQKTPNTRPHGRQSTIAKWPAPANLPAKPPQPATGMPAVSIPRDPDNPQPLPPKPIQIR